LVELELGLRSCYTISLSDLLDASPNLRTLRITGCECHDVLQDFYNEDSVKGNEDDAWLDIWKGSSDFVSSSVRPHSSLTFLDAGVSMRSEEMLHKTVQKFSNLEELWIGPRVNYEINHSHITLQSIFTILQDLRSLKRLKSNREGEVNMVDLVETLLAAG
jgi:hypothetical protein